MFLAMRKAKELLCTLGTSFLLLAVPNPYAIMPALLGILL